MLDHLTTDETIKTSAVSAPLMLMKFGRLFTFRVARMKTSMVERRTGRIAATTRRGWRSVSPIVGGGKVWSLTMSNVLERSHVEDQMEHLEAGRCISLRRIQYL